MTTLGQPLPPLATSDVFELDQPHLSIQDTTDIYLTKRDPGEPWIRQHIRCLTQGLSIAVYEMSTDDGLTWTAPPNLALHVRHTDEGPLGPLGFEQPVAMPSIPGMPSAGPRKVLPKLFEIAGEVVLAYQLPWDRQFTIEHIPLSAPAGKWMPFYQYEGTPRTVDAGADALEPMPPPPGDNCRTFRTLVYGTQVQQYCMAHAE